MPEGIGYDNDNDNSKMPPSEGIALIMAGKQDKMKPEEDKPEEDEGLSEDLVKRIFEAAGDHPDLSGLDMAAVKSRLDANPRLAMELISRVRGDEIEGEDDDMDVDPNRLGLPE